MADSLQNLVFQLCGQHTVWNPPCGNLISPMSQFTANRRISFVRPPHQRKRYVTRSARLYSATASRIPFTLASCASASTASLVPKMSFCKSYSLVSSSAPTWTTDCEAHRTQGYAVLRSNLLLGVGGHVRKDLACSVGQGGWRAALLQHGCFRVPSNASRMLP